MTLTNQTAFEIMVNHLLNQGEKSASAEDETSCVYRNFDGLKCAIGAILPDELYEPSMEGILAHTIAFNYPKVGKLWENISLNFLSKMQYVHDNKQVDEWYNEFKAIADEFNLSMPEK